MSLRKTTGNKSFIKKCKSKLPFLHKKMQLINIFPSQNTRKTTQNIHMIILTRARVASLLRTKQDIEEFIFQ